MLSSYVASAREERVERGRPKCLLLSYRFAGVHSSTAGQFQNRLLPLLIPVTSQSSCPFRHGAANGFLLLLVAECFNHPLLASFMPTHSLGNISAFMNVYIFPIWVSHCFPIRALMDHYWWQEWPKASAGRNAILAVNFWCLQENRMASLSELVKFW